MLVPPYSRRWATLAFVALAAVVILYYRPPSQPMQLPVALTSAFTSKQQNAQWPRPPANSRWRNLPQQHPVSSFIPLPTGAPVPRPRIQHDFDSQAESAKARKIRLDRLDTIREAFKHSWKAYQAHAWGHDEVMPLTLKPLDPFGGWAATLVDSLDTLWLMGLKTEFDDALRLVEKLDFNSASKELINVFETTIRVLGGLLGAYDLSGEEVLLEKALEVGEMLYASFDTPNRMPNSRWDWNGSAHNQPFSAGGNVVSAELGSMSLEFSRLTQLSGEAKYYDAIARISRIFAEQQDRSNLPGLWPVFVNAAQNDVATGTAFGIGAMADSLYEYLPKTWALLGGHAPEYRQMYDKALAAAKAHLFYRPLNPWKPGQLLAAGEAHAVQGKVQNFDARTQHLTCFAGGMVAVAARLFGRPDDVAVGRALADGCIWAYNVTTTGIGAEIWMPAACETPGAASAATDPCAWDAARWHTAVAHGGYFGSDGDLATDPAVVGARIAADAHLPPGVVSFQDRAYQLRPEALESVWVLYRVTGDAALREQGWAMFEAVARHCRTPHAFAGLADVTASAPPLNATLAESEAAIASNQRDRMESFWTAETLKYAYLLFSDEDVVSLDEWVLNTEAHPLRLP